MPLSLFPPTPSSLLALRRGHRPGHGGGDLPKLSKKRQLGNVLDEYIEEKMQRGLCATTTANEQRARLRGWLADALEEDIARLTSKRAAAHYERVVTMPTRKTGRPPTAQLHT